MSAHHACHDLKTERTDVLQPLPGVLRLLPFAFYVAALASILLTSVFYLQLRKAQETKKLAIAEEQRQLKMGKDLDGIISSVRDEVAKADELVSWVEGTREIQSLTVAVTRSMDTESTIAELSFDRKRDNPSQVQIGLKINGSGAPVARQVDQTLEELDRLNYRSYSATQVQEKGALHYSATLIHQDPNG